MMSSWISRTFTDLSLLTSHRFVVTVKLVELVAVPAGVVTLIAPLAAPAGTAVLICVGDTTVKLVALVRLNRTTVAPFRFMPAIVTGVPALPLDGSMPVTKGGLYRVVAEASLENPDVPVPLVA